MFAIISFIRLYYLTSVSCANVNTKQEYTFEDIKFLDVLKDIALQRGL